HTARPPRRGCSSARPGAAGCRTPPSRRASLPACRTPPPSTSRTPTTAAGTTAARDGARRPFAPKSLQRWPPGWSSSGRFDTGREVRACFFPLMPLVHRWVSVLVAVTVLVLPSASHAGQSASDLADKAMQECEQGRNAEEREA